jgi:hypothetical protein
MSSTETVNQTISNEALNSPFFQELVRQIRAQDS